MKTEEELRELKANWQADPIYDIEDTPGFEEYRDELLAFRQKCEDQWTRAADYRTVRSTKFNLDKAVYMIECANRIEGVWGPQEMLFLAIAHGILALVAEIKRANDFQEGK